LSRFCTIDSKLRHCLHAGVHPATGQKGRVMRAKLLCLAVGLLLASSAARATGYSFLFKEANNGFSYGAKRSGFITTDGFLGALTAEHILTWELTTLTASSVFCVSSCSTAYTFGSASGGTLDFDPGSLVATATSVYYDSLNFTAGFEFSNGSNAHFNISPEPVQTLPMWINPGSTFLNPFGLPSVSTVQLASVAVSGPNPVVSAGLPGFVMAVTGVLAWRRRRVRSLPEHAARYSERPP